MYPYLRSNSFQTRAGIPIFLTKRVIEDEEVEPQQCGNCGVWRQVKDFMVEKCPNCGDDEYDYLEESQRHFPV